MLRFLFRLLATIVFAVAVVLTVLDATRSVAVSALVMTPLGEIWLVRSPSTLAVAQEYVEKTLGPQLWNSAAVAILSMPGFAVFAALALILYMAGYDRRRQECSPDYQ